MKHFHVARSLKSIESESVPSNKKGCFNSHKQKKKKNCSEKANKTQKIGSSVNNCQIQGFFIHINLCYFLVAIYSFSQVSFDY